MSGPRLAAGEILTAIRIPAQPTGSGVSYQRFSLRRGQALAVAEKGRYPLSRLGRVPERERREHFIREGEELAGGPSLRRLGRPPTGPPPGERTPPPRQNRKK